MRCGDRVAIRQSGGTAAGARLPRRPARTTRARQVVRHEDDDRGLSDSPLSGGGWVGCERRDKSRRQELRLEENARGTSAWTLAFTRPAALLRAGSGGTKRATLLLLPPAPMRRLVRI